jgi:Xaa-Pro aminopeptidase
VIEAWGPEHAARIAAFQQTLRSLGLDGALLVHGTDVYYLSGTRQNAALWIPSTGDGVLLVRRSLARAQAEATLGDVRPFPATRDLRAALVADAAGALRVGLTFDVATVAVQQIYERALAPVELVDVSAPLREQRSVKSSAEIACIREAGRLLSAAYRDVPAFLRPGMTEIAVAAELDLRLRRAGSEGVPRVRGFNQEPAPGVVSAGESATIAGCFDGPVVGQGLSAAAPMGASRSVIARDTPVVLDYTAVSNGYVVDMTRVAVCGRLPAEAQRAFEVALAIQAELAAALRPGAIPSALWARAVELATQAGLADRFMGPPGGQARFVGHGVGLELDELPVLAPRFDEPLVAGQVLAVEPKFVFPGIGAVGIENTWAVAERGGVRLSELGDDLLQGAAP